MASLMKTIVSMQEATEKSLKELHHQVSELKKQKPQSNQYFRPSLTENNIELTSSDNVAKDTSQEKENVETIEKNLQDSLPRVKIVTVMVTSD
jgi:small-conductance mechanosensitive channel